MNYTKKMNLNKSDIAKTIPVVYKKEAIKIIDLIFETITKTLETGETVKIAHLGRFDVLKTKPRVATNFRGKMYRFRSRKVVKFRPANAFVGRLNIKEE